MISLPLTLAGLTQHMTSLKACLLMASLPGFAFFRKTVLIRCGDFRCAAFVQSLKFSINLLLGPMAIRHFIKPVLRMVASVLRRFELKGKMDVFMPRP